MITNYKYNKRRYGSIHITNYCKNNEYKLFSDSHTECHIEHSRIGGYSICRLEGEISCAVRGIVPFGDRDIEGRPFFDIDKT